MGRKLRKYFRLLFKFFLLIQLYCYLNLEVDAVLYSRHENGKTCNERQHHNGTTYLKEETEKNLARAKRPARMIPAQYFSIQKEKIVTFKDNKPFYGPAFSCAEISKLGYTLNGYYLVKGKNQTKIEKIRVLIGCRFKHPNGIKAVKEERIGFIDIEITNKSADKLKRPARLIPLKILLRKSKNNTENEAQARFYGPATNCEELGKLGYTLNGLYLVDSPDHSKKGIQIEVIECRFKQPHGSKNAKEERIGFVNIEAKKTKTVHRRHLSALKETRIIRRPARLLPLHILFGKEKNETEVVERFYDHPKSCSDLGKIGYTLNGYYLVKGAVSNSNLIEIALCKFHQSLGATESLKEERFVLVPEANKGLKLIPLDHGRRNESYPLMNLESRKCLDAHRDANDNSVLIETDCKPYRRRNCGNCSMKGSTFATMKTLLHYA